MVWAARSVAGLAAVVVKVEVLRLLLLLVVVVVDLPTRRPSRRVPLYTKRIACVARP